MEQHAEDRMGRLYEQFRRQLSNQSETVYYDEQELVDIFDYAGDVRDDYVRLEVILLGNRLFPDSADLMKRRAVLLSDLSGEALASFVKDNRIAENGDVMWAIFRTRATAPKGEEARNALADIIDNYRLEEDEETIQFVNLVRQLQQEDWLISNLERVKKSCSYKPTLLYEIARISETPKQMQVSISILEELTMDDPFNTDYWGLLAELQSGSEKYSDALSSLDYAKALSPDDPDLLSLEGYVRLKMSQPAEAFEILSKAIELAPDSYPARRNLLEACKLTEQTDKARQIAAALFAQDPTDSSILLDMLQLYPERTPQILSGFYENNTDEDEATAIERIGQVCIAIGSDVALDYMRWYREHFPVSQTAEFAFLELLYVNKRYDEAKEFILTRFSKLVLEPNEVPIVAIMASTLVRVGDYENALAFCQIWIAKLKQSELKRSAYRLVNRGLIETLHDIESLLRSNPAPTDKQLDDILL